MPKAAKLVRNTLNWGHVSSYARTGSGVMGMTIAGQTYYDGFEDWLNNPIFRELKIVYLDPL